MKANVSYSHRRNHSPHHYALPLNFTVFLRHECSQFLRLTNLLISDSSQKRTIFHCSSVYRICSVVKPRETFWFFFEIKGLQHGIRGTSFSLFNLRETVFLDSDIPVRTQNVLEIEVPLSKRTLKDILTIIRFSRLVVIWALPLLGFGSSVLSALNLLITWWKTLFDLRTMPEISEHDLPSSWFAKMSFFSSRVKELYAFDSILL